MSKQYKLSKPFRYWKTGDVVEEYIYKRFPDEFKQYVVLVQPTPTVSKKEKPNESVAEIINMVQKRKNKTED